MIYQEFFLLVTSNQYDALVQFSKENSEEFRDHFFKHPNQAVQAAADLGLKEIMALFLKLDPGLADRALVWSAARNQLEIARFLLHNGAQVNNLHGFDALSEACKGGHSEMAQLLTPNRARKEKMDRVTCFNYDVVLNAGASGNWDLCQFLLSYAVENKLRLDPRHLRFGAIQGGHLHILDHLDKGLTEKERQEFYRSNYSDYKHYFYQAAANGHLSMVKFLILQGGGIFKITKALARASEGGHLAVISCLLSYALNEKERADWKSIALDGAVSGGQEAAVRVLLSQGADLNYRDEDTGKRFADDYLFGAYPRGNYSGSEARPEGYDNIIFLLLSRGENPDRLLLSTSMSYRFLDIVRHSPRLSLVLNYLPAAERTEDGVRSHLSRIFIYSPEQAGTAAQEIIQHYYVELAKIELEKHQGKIALNSIFIHSPLNSNIICCITEFFRFLWEPLNASPAEILAFQKNLILPMTRFYFALENFCEEVESHHPGLKTRNIDQVLICCHKARIYLAHGRNFVLHLKPLQRGLLALSQSLIGASAPQQQSLKSKTAALQTSLSFFESQCGPCVLMRGARLDCTSIINPNLFRG